MPIGLALKVECVDPGGKIVGLMSSSRAHTPASGFRAVGEGLADMMASGFTPKCSMARSLPVRNNHLDFVDHQQDAVLVEHLLESTSS